MIGPIDPIRPDGFIFCDLVTHILQTAFIRGVTVSTISVLKITLEVRSMKSSMTLVALALFLIFVYSASAQDGMPKLSIPSLEHSFGSVKAGTPLNYSFEVKNTGKSNLEIKTVSPSCGCTTSKFDKVIAPGKVG